MAGRGRDNNKNAGEHVIELTREEAHEIGVKRLLGELVGMWSPEEARWHAREFIRSNRTDNLVRQLAEAFIELQDERADRG